MLIHFGCAGGDARAYDCASVRVLL